MFKAPLSKIGRTKRKFVASWGFGERTPPLSLFLVQFPHITGRHVERIQRQVTDLRLVDFKVPGGCGHDRPVDQTDGAAPQARP